MIRTLIRKKSSAAIRRNIAQITIVLFLFAIFGLQAKAQDQYNPPPPPPPPNQSAQPNQQQPPPPPPPGSEEGAPGEQGPPPAPVPPAQLDRLVMRIALYPDPLLAQILTASTYWDQIPDAAGWANQHAYLHGDALADAIRADNLQWDASVLALIPFPSVLNMMAQDPGWTEQLGNAVLTQRPDVMDAVQRERQQSYRYGYLRSGAYDNVVNDGGDIEILPVNPAYIYVPTYNPAIVFGPPAPGFFIGGAIRFGPAIVIGAGFAPFGWAHPYFGWRAHSIYFDARPWGRTWVNRGVYVHPYAHPYVHGPGPRVEHHEVHHR
jgi:hypothetical protein